MSLGKILTIAAGSAVLIGGAMYLADLEKESNEAPDQKKAAAVHKPERENIVCKVFNGQMIVKWFEQHDGDSMIRIIGKVTPHTMKLFAREAMPANLDPEHHVFMAIVDKKSSQPKIFCLVNFTSLDNEIQEYFSQQEFMIVND